MRATFTAPKPSVPRGTRCCAYGPQDAGIGLVHMKDVIEVRILVDVDRAMGPGGTLLVLEKKRKVNAVQQMNENWHPEADRYPGF